MNAKTSYFNFTVFKKNLTLFCPVWIFYLLTLFIQIPFSIWNIIQQSERYQVNYTISDLTNTVNYTLLNSTANYFSITFQALYTMICAGIVFRYLFNSRSAGMIHALPLKRICLYISNSLSGLVMIFIPQILIMLITLPIIVFKGYGNISCMLAAFGAMAGYSFFFYCLAILCAMLVGHYLALPAMFGFFNFFVLIGEYIIRGFLSILLFGYSVDSEPITLGFLSPLYYFLTNLNTLSNKKVPYYSPSTVTSIIIYALLGIVILVVSYLIYRSRKIETSGDPISLKKLQPILKLAVTFVTSCSISFLIYGTLNQNNLSNSADFILLFILVLITGIVCSYSYEMLFQKSFRVFKRGIPGVILYCSAITLTLIAIKLDATGFTKHLPDSVNVKGVTVYANGSSIITSNSSSIKELIDIHQQIIDERADIIDDASRISNNYDSNTSSFLYTLNFSYKMRNGKTMTRSYTIPVTEESMKNTGQYAGKLKAFLDNPQNLLDTISSYSHKDKKLTSITLDPYLYDESYEDEPYDKQIVQSNYKNSDLKSYSVTDHNINELLEAIQKDIQLGSLKMDDYYLNKKNEDILYMLNICYDNYETNYVSSNNFYSFIVTKDCENILAFIEKYKDMYAIN